MGELSLLALSRRFLTGPGSHWVFSLLVRLAVSVCWEAQESMTAPSPRERLSPHFEVVIRELTFSSVSTWKKNLQWLYAMVVL